MPTGGSLKGTTLNEGEYGLRLLAPARLSAKQLQSAETALKRKLKVVKGAQVFLRVFPDSIRSKELIDYMKSSRKSSSRSWLLDCATRSSEWTSS